LSSNTHDTARLKQSTEELERANREEQQVFDRIKLLSMLLGDIETQKGEIFAVQRSSQEVTRELTLKLKSDLINDLKNNIEQLKQRQGVLYVQGVNLTGATLA
jgi:hypothetical protein